MQSIDTAISEARKILKKKCVWKFMDTEKVKAEKLQYIEGSSSYRSVYFALHSKDEAIYYAVKVTGSEIEDYYLLSDIPITNEIFENKFHCFEVEPETKTIIAKYYLIAGLITREIKFSEDNNSLQENFLCTYDFLPKDFKKIVDNSSIRKDLVTGYSVKPYGNMILVNADQ